MNISSTNNRFKKCWKERSEKTEIARPKRKHRKTSEGKRGEGRGFGKAKPMFAKSGKAATYCLFVPPATRSRCNLEHRWNKKSSECRKSENVECRRSGKLPEGSVFCKAFQKFHEHRPIIIITCSRFSLPARQVSDPSPW